MMNRLKILILLFGFMAILSGCAQKSYSIPNVYLETQSPITAASYRAVDKLLLNQNPTIGSMATPDSNVSILVSTLVNVNSLSNSNAFGRLVAEQMAGRIAQHQIKVNEVKLRGKLFIDNGGEFLLSRELKDISSKQNADLVMVGTYAIGGSQVYVSVKLVRADDSRVSSSYNFSVEKTRDIQGLLMDLQH
jgi:TolB-like protein